MFQKAFTSVSKSIQQRNAGFNITYIWSTVGGADDENEEWFGMLNNVKGHIKSEGQSLKDTIGKKVDEAFEKQDILEQKITGMKEILEFLENNSASLT